MIKSRGMEPGRDILVVGSGNAETVLDLQSDLVIGQKHDVKRVELYGGSGVNYTLRLAHYDGTRVLPILSIGQDGIGKSIQQELLQAMDAQRVRTPASDFVAHPDLLCIGLTTPQSTVVTAKPPLSAMVLVSTRTSPPSVAMPWPPLPVTDERWASTPTDPTATPVSPLSATAERSRRSDPCR